MIDLWMMIYMINMKTKLLKKVRKRFDITHYPKGIMICNTHYNYNLYVLTDKTNSFYQIYAELGSNKFTGHKEIFTTEKQCIDYLKSVIIKRLIHEGYSKNRNNRLINKSKKVWYV